ncbi:MAG: CHAD domain-containing protein, partial [Actinobacteria bacterium]|nr:CHAD domain-containing protein [Actinomycetota bacterium]NIU66813.1 CHAD domain-containing protein [Actinomycetota bacterium]
AVGLLAGARADLRPATEQHFDGGIHDARKKLKRLRALLRLVRDDIGDSAYHNENVVLRDTARTLAGMRDAGVLRTTLVS